MLSALIATLLSATAEGPPRFVDQTQEAGIPFRHRNGAGGEKHLVETMSGGGGFWDFDLDGDLDIYLLNGAPLSGYSGPMAFTSALYRNDRGRFVDVTDRAGLSGAGYAMGSVAADYDNDGDADLFVTGFGPSRLYRNEGDGTFRDVSLEAAIDTVAFAAGAAFADIEGDGDLDLYVTTYIDYRLDNPVFCGDRKLGLRDYCHPNNYEGARDVLYRNDGDGTFTDISPEAGIASQAGRGLGVLFTDGDEDGDPDIYVTNDAMMNFFFRNEGSGRFQETALAMGVGFDEDGRAEGSMGIDAGDYDGDGKLDLFVTNLESEGNALYRNLGDGTYADIGSAAGLALPSLLWVGFGAGFFDPDNDADADLFVANGHVMARAGSLSDVAQFAQPKQLYENDGGRYRDVSLSAGEIFAREQVGRGVAFGDWDEDGAPDVLVMNNDDVPNLLRNVTTNENHWTRLHLVGRASNRDGVGARLTIEAGGVKQTDELRSGYSYLSMHDMRMHFGLGAAEVVDRLEIRWPSGLVQSVSGLPAGRTILIVEGLPPKL